MHFATMGMHNLALLLHAGLFLFLVQPFRIGDRVSIGLSNNVASAAAGPTATTASPASALLASAAAGAASQGNGAPSGWFEGTCEKLDLRYTVLR